MSGRIKMLLLGATGETGSDVLAGLLKDADYTGSGHLRSLAKPAVRALEDRGLTIVSGASTASAEDLSAILKLHNISLIVSVLGPLAQLEQLKWIDAAVLAGVGRFIPCGFTTIAPRGGVMLIRDEKEEVHDHLFRAKLPFSIIDVGFWYQISFFTAPSGKLDTFASFQNDPVIYAGGDAPNLLIDKRDIGRYVARIAKDPRTLNRRVAAYGAELTQNQIVDITQQVLNEKLKLTHVSEQDIANSLSQAVEAAKQAPPDDFKTKIPVFVNQYNDSKFVRKDNTLANAKYLGYLDAYELYPDFQPNSFEDFLRQMLAGEGKRPYEQANW